MSGLWGLLNVTCYSETQNDISAKGATTFFIQMADPQLGFFADDYLITPLLKFLGLNWYQNWIKEDAHLLEQAISHANRLNPAFVIICGDLIQDPGHKYQTAEYKRIVQLLSKSIPLYVLPGNHDIGDKPTEESLAWYRQTFGPDWYSFQEGNVYGIVLNSIIIDEEEAVPDSSNSQLNWLKKELALAKISSANHILVFQHHPLFLEDPNEKDQYFNLAKPKRDLYSTLFEEAGVEAVFAGHYHRNSRGKLGAMQMITSGPIGRPLKDGVSGMTFVHVNTNGVKAKFFAMTDIPEQVTPGD